MSIRLHYILAGGIAAIALIASLLFYSRFPEQMASHWNAAGEVDGTMPKFWGAFLMPIVMMGMVALFAILPSIDPLKENVKAFRKYYDGFVLLMTAFLGYIHALVILWNIGYEYDMGRMILPAIAALFYYIGCMLKHAKRNWFVGIRTPWTLSNDTVWKGTHELGSMLFKILALITLAIGFSPEPNFVLFLTATLSIVAITIVYSYLLYRKNERGS